MSRIAVCIALALSLIAPVSAETIRVATFDTELQRRGPGLLLRDIQRGADPQVVAVIEVIAHTAPDILVLQGIDWDYDNQTLKALEARLAQAGQPYPHLFSARPNSGVETGLDMDGDGRLAEASDAQGYGVFTGQGGVAILSRFPILTDEIQDFSDLLWRDLPGALLPQHPDGSAFPSAEAQAMQRLSSTVHWVVPVAMPDGPPLTLLTFRATPPVFDGPEDRNGRRNHDEIAFWQHYLAGEFGPAPTGRYVLAGNANLDPVAGQGRHDAIRSLLGGPLFQDPEPQGPVAAQDTVDWPRVGRMRVDYVLPSPDLSVTGSGVYWPAPDQPGWGASRHRLVWIDLRLE